MCQDCGCHSHEGATITLPVNGMSCGHCKRAVEEALAELEGVSHVNVDLENNLVSFRLSNEDNKATVDDVKTAIVNAGFTIN